MSAWRSQTRARSEKATRSWLWRSLWVAIAFLIIPSGFSKEGMDRNARIEIIRGLLREMAVTKVPLPRGKKGVRVDAQGKLDQADAQKEMHLNGMAMQAGAPAVITKIEFKSSQVVFEVNGGGKSRQKWYQHIEIDGGMGVTPVASGQPPTTAFGSSITVDFGKALPDLTVAQVKTILSGTLDFERHSPTVLYSPNLPPQFKEAIKNHKSWWEWTATPCFPPKARRTGACARFGTASSRKTGFMGPLRTYSSSPSMATKWYP